jgi:hypothetical protein
VDPKQLTPTSNTFPTADGMTSHSAVSDHFSDSATVTEQKTDYGQGKKIPCQKVGEARKKKKESDAVK